MLPLNVHVPDGENIHDIRRRTSEKLEEYRTKHLGAGEVEPKVITYHWGDNGMLYIESSTYSDPSTLEQLSNFVQRAIRGEPVHIPNFAAAAPHQPRRKRSIQRFRIRR